MPHHPLNPALRAVGANFSDLAGVHTAIDFGGTDAEYAAARTGAAIYPARDRALIEVRGKDRAAWLHNLTTNAVKTLQPGQGIYAFVINLKGRILFDLNILAMADALWLDLDVRAVPKALAHFDEYTISEDVLCRDRSGEFTRLALCGPSAAEIADALGAVDVQDMPALASRPVPLAGKHRLLVRHDMAGVFGVELYVDTADAETCWRRLLEIGAPVQLRPAGWQALNTLRIEAGIPRYGQDIDETVLPAETRQLERAVSFTKGCYLGQEVVERMRAHNAAANLLVGLRFDGAANDVLPAVAASLRSGTWPQPVADPAPSLTPLSLQQADQDRGRVTSVCFSPAAHAWIGLGYVRSLDAAPGGKFQVATQPPLDAEIVSLPIGSVTESAAAD